MRWQLGKVEVRKKWELRRQATVAAHFSSGIAPVFRQSPSPPLNPPPSNSHAHDDFTKNRRPRSRLTRGVCSARHGAGSTGPRQRIRNSRDAGESPGRLADLSPHPSRPGTRHAGRSEPHLLLEGSLPPALHLQEQRLCLCPRLQHGHGALEVASDDADPEDHRAWNVQRDRLFNQGGKARNDLSRSGIGKKLGRLSAGRQLRKVEQTGSGGRSGGRWDAGEGKTVGS